MSNPLLESASQTQYERLFHINFRLYFLGTVNRNDLVSRFGIKVAATTRGLTLYKEPAPKNLEYDTKAKTYIQRDSLNPLFSYSGHQVLAALLPGFGDDFISAMQTFSTAAAPIQLNLSACNILATVTRAIHNQQAIQIHCRPLSSGLTQRDIVPHTLVDNGLRWHLRVFDRSRQQLAIPVRAAVAGYVLRRWNVDCSSDHRLSGPEYPLWLQSTQALAGIENLIFAPDFPMSA